MILSFIETMELKFCMSIPIMNTITMHLWYPLNALYLVLIDMQYFLFIGSVYWSIRDRKTFLTFTLLRFPLVFHGIVRVPATKNCISVQPV